MFRRKIRSALFVDFQNMAGKLGAGFAKAAPEWLAWLEDGQFDGKRAKRTFLEKRVYMDLNNYNALSSRFQELGFDTIPTAADMMIALDTAESLYCLLYTSPSPRD